jgi:hypothetical protein
MFEVWRRYVGRRREETEHGEAESAEEEYEERDDYTE